MTPERILAFDVESNGLHGPAFAIGAVLLDADGTELESFYACSPLPRAGRPLGQTVRPPRPRGATPRRTVRLGRCVQPSGTG